MLFATAIRSPRSSIQRPTLSSILTNASMLVACVLSLAGCNTVSVNKQMAAQTIQSQRGNIVTDNQLSTHTAAALLSAGLNEQACLQSFKLCLTQLENTVIDTQTRSDLAIYAELHYAKALQLADSSPCAAGLARPPIDPYYANAPVPPDERAAQQRRLTQCLISYQRHLNAAITTSFAYLFYDRLTATTANADEGNDSSHAISRIANDIDIQTQDIYNAASNDLISQLYQSINKTDHLMGNMQVSYLLPPDIDPSTPIANRAPIEGNPRDQIKVMQLKNDEYLINVHLPNESSYLQNARQRTAAFTDLVSTYDLRLSGLNSISKRPGLGISLVASLDDRHTTTIRQLLSASLGASLGSKLGVSDHGRSPETQRSAESAQEDPASRIYPTGHLVMTGLVQPLGERLDDVLASRELDIHLYNPYKTDRVTVLGLDTPLAANFSAGYGLWLAENQLDGVGYLSLITRQDNERLPKLFMLEPYNPDKRVIIMLHGLASSPATWVNLTNDILNDADLRDHYQVWQIFYPTNLPIIENRYHIQRLIETAYEITDPKGDNRASQHSVLIGHSMGAVISRMMLSDDNLVDDLDALDTQHQQPMVNNNDIFEALKASLGAQRIDERFNLHRLPQVDTAVFLSAPFRGTDYADRWFTRALRRIVYLPVGLVKTITENLATIASEGELAQNPLGALYLQNGASQLSDQSSFIQLTKDIRINEAITYHSIIANNDPDIAQGIAQSQQDGVTVDLSQSQRDTSRTANSDIGAPTRSASDDAAPKIASVMVTGDISQSLTKRLSDGIVPYRSAHLEGAASETIVSGGHSIQTSPQTILTLRRILKQPLED